MNIHPPIGGSSEEEGAKTGKLRKKTKHLLSNLGEEEKFLEIDILRKIYSSKES